jgi:hypothetical protein
VFQKSYLGLAEPAVKPPVRRYSSYSTLSR